MQDSYYTPADSTCLPATNYISRTMPAQTMELVAMGTRVELLRQRMNRSPYMLNCMQEQQYILNCMQELLQYVLIHTTCSTVSFPLITWLQKDILWISIG